MEKDDNEDELNAEEQNLTPAQKKKLKKKR